jgi:hypothetical protein
MYLLRQSHTHFVVDQCSIIQRCGAAYDCLMRSLLDWNSDKLKTKGISIS